MVVTSRILQEKMGVDPEIADYFANQRPVPANNLFWNNKRIYLSSGFGFLTIPFAFDLMFKCGISKSVLLDDRHVTLMENGFDQLKRYENQLISSEDFLNACKQLLKEHIKQPNLASDLFSLFSGMSPRFFQFEQQFKALARSDSFLFTLVDMDVADKWVSDFLPYWYALARPILLLDDFKDLMEDRVSNDENTIIELGNDKAAILKAYELGLQDLNLLQSINPELGAIMKKLLEDALNFQHIKGLLS